MAKADKRKSFIGNLYKCNGQIYKTCYITGIAPVTFYRWVDKYPEFAEKVDNIKNGIHEHVEDKLFENIENGSVSAQLGYLNRKHPEYKQKGNEIKFIKNNISVKLANLSNEQINSFITKRYGIGEPEIVERSSPGKCLESQGAN